MIKVGITEIDIGYEDKEYAREHCLEVMQEAYENGVELLVFPEMTLTGFTMMPARMWEAYRDGEIPESVSFFMENSRKYDMAMVFGYIEAFMADGSGEFDGATGFQKMKSIILPLMVPSFVICLFFTLSRAFMVYDVNLTLTGGEPYGTTKLVAMHVYDKAFTARNYGVGQAEALILFVIVALISGVQIYIGKKKEVEA